MFKKFFIRKKSELKFNPELQYYILRNNVKKLKKYSSTDIINQKYISSQLPVVTILLNRVISESDDIREHGTYINCHSYFIWLKNPRTTGDLTLLSVDYTKIDNIITTTSQQVKYDNSCIFDDFEAFCIASVFDFIISIKTTENTMLDEIQENENKRKIRDTIC